MAEKQLKVLVAQRSSVRQSTTKSLKAIDEALAETPVNTVAAKSKIELLKELKTKLVALDDQILPLVDDAQLSNEADRAQQYQDNISSCIAETGLQLSNLEPSSSSPSPHNLGFGRDTVPKLPKLEIPKFEGNPLQWEEFWDSFQASIHNRTDLPDIDKFKYLKAFLKGEALRMVEGYRLTTANYSEVLQAMQERFGDPEMAVFAHFESLIGLSPASYDLPELRCVLDKCESHIRSLVALGLPESTFGVVFTPLIISKLPRGVKMELDRKNGSKKWSLANLRILLKDEITARENCERFFAASKEIDSAKRVKSSSNSNSNSREVSRKPPSSSTSLLTSPTQSQTKSSPPGCAFCSGKHYSGECRSYPDVNGRRKRLNNQCFCCLRKGHNAKDCRSKKPCYFCKRETHHQSLCPQQYGRRSNEQEETMVAATVDKSSSGKAQDGSPESNLSLQSPNSKAILQTAITEIKGPSGHSNARLYFDTGGSRSFVSTAMVKKIGAKCIGEESVSVDRFRDSRHSTISYRIYEFDICLPGQKVETVRMSGEHTISCPIQPVPVDGSVFVNVKLAEPPVSEPTMVTIDILIGSDYSYKFIGGNQLRYPNGVVLLESPFGFVTGGILNTSKDSRTVESSLLLHTKAHSDPCDGLERFWGLEDIGIKDDPYHTDDEKALKCFNDTVGFVDGRYQVKWPWKEQIADLPSNFGLAYGRLKSLVQRIGDNQEVINKYDAIIKEQQKKKIIEVAPHEPDGVVHYLPHHAVVSPLKTTTKVRIVYDASAKASKQSASLNECLYRGPVFLANLVGIILRWRLPNIAMVSDIEKAFLQVALHKSQRDVTRFLWCKDPTKPPTKENIQAYRFCRVPFGVISSPFLLAATVAHHLKKTGGPTATSIQTNVYVDNVFGGAPSTAEAIQYYREAKTLFSEASMNLREWYSNSSEFLQEIKEEDRGAGESTSVLGLKWNLLQDCFHIPSTRLHGPKEGWTKRHILKLLASVFDPCGILSPVTICGKILMQKLWKLKLNWDDPLPRDIVSSWQAILTSLVDIPQITIKRQLPQPTCDGSHIELHCFCDASKNAYSSAVYLRITNVTTTTSDLIFVKSRVAPVKALSIPKLELMAVIIGVRSSKFVEAELQLPIAGRFLWTDSCCVLQWIRSNTVTTTFVRNRLAEIRLSTNLNFGYVPTEENPADVPSRGVTCQALQNNSLWWQGPPWLTLQRNNWPKQDKLSGAGVKHDQLPPEETSLAATEEVKTDEFMDLSRFSGLTKLLRTTAYCQRFVDSLKSNRSSGSDRLCAQELLSARLFWERRVQKACLHGVMADKQPARHRNIRRQLNLFIDSQGFICCGGRYSIKSVADEEMCPKLLPKNHPFTKLIIMDCHRQVHHSGVKHTLAQLRQAYWITDARSQIKRALGSCNLCRIYTGTPYKTPSVAPLPEFRTTRCRPFEVLGIDYAGPLLIRNAIDKTMQKVWICLFTCAGIRAIHLEVVESLSTGDFLLCLRRFIATYGKPRVIISDNARQFHAADRTLKQLWKNVLRDKETQDLSANYGIEWKFIPELAPWMGGFYERMIGVVKSALKKTILNRCVTLTEMQTVICEVTAIINSRPLLYGEQSVEGDYLSPAHFLLRNSHATPSFSITEEYQVKPLLPDVLILEWRRIQSLLDGFWKTWQSSYLQSLQEYIWRPPNRNTSQRQPTVGTVVIIKDSTRRSTWKLGIITELLASHDGVARSAVVRTAGNKLFRRALKLLVPLESQAAQCETAPSVGNPVQTPRHLPKRTAKSTAALRIQRQLQAPDDEVDE